MKAMNGWIRLLALIVLCASVLQFSGINGCSSSRKRAPEGVAPPAPAEPMGRTPGPESIDAPEISRSVGIEGGVILFWPRVIPTSASAESGMLAAALQERLRTVIERALPGRTIDVRPEPERVCPRAGCLAMTVGVLLMRDQEGCAAVALISGPGTAPTSMIPWVGNVRLRDRVVPFREYPESRVTVVDFAPCATLLDNLAEKEAEIISEIIAKSL